MSSGQMQAGVLVQPKQLELQIRPVPTPGAQEVLLKMELLGICGSDVSLYLGHRSSTPFPLIIGHEGIGRIEQLGPNVTGLQLGQKVVIEPNFPCGHCDMCWSGRSNICVHKRIFGVLEPGCFAEYALVPAQFVWPIPDNVRDEDAVLIEPLAVALHGLYTAPARPGDVLAVVGLGAIGLLLTQLACRMGYQVLAYDRVSEKIDLAEQLGAVPLAADSSEADLAKNWQKARVSAIFECAGAAPALTMAIAAAPRGANVVVLGLADQASALTEFTLTRQGIQVLSSIIYQHPLDFQRSIRLLEQGFIQPSKIISQKTTFSNLPAALEKASKGHDSKIIFSV
jgi:2-desacetyl-2-hydroxyethyl bacteriochlorophyllide A dehydrogenase